jgi:predicted porin
MNKSMIVAGCLAIGAASAQAQSTVQLVGLVDTYVGSMKMAGDAVRKSTVGSGGMTTSWWGMTGSEDLGGGMKAGFFLTSFFRADTGEYGRFANDNPFSRDANVSLSGGYGTLTLGRSKAPNFLPTVIFNPLGDSYTFSPLVLHSSVGLFNGTGWKATVPADTGWSNQITYSTPTFGGLKANLHYQFGEQAAAADQAKHNVGLNVFYASGPVGLTAYWERDEINNPASSNLPIATGTQQNWMVGGTYDAGVVKAFATVGKSFNTVDSVNKQTTSLGISAPMGGGKLLAAVAHTEDDVAAKSRTTMTVGYDYNLSKRTDVYAMLMQDKITTFETGNSFGLGVRHRF